ncbi:hypothetical protein D9M68_924690 [compost metagenome]
MVLPSGLSVMPTGVMSASRKPCTANLMVAFTLWSLVLTTLTVASSSLVTQSSAPPSASTKRRGRLPTLMFLSTFF